MGSLIVRTIKGLSDNGNILEDGMYVTGVSTFTGNVTVGGTLTYDDVTNIDSVGMVTAQGGINVSAGNVKVTAGIVTVGGGVTISSDFIHLTDNSKIQLGIASDLEIYHDGSNSIINDAGTGNLRLATGGTTKVEVISTGASVYGALKLQNGLLRENVNRNTSAAANAATALNLDNGMVHWFTTNLGAANVKMNIVSGVGINTDMAIGDMISVTIMTAVNNTSYFIEQVRVDGVEASAGVTTYWAGGSAPTAGGGSGVDSYAFNIVKTASARYDMIANQVKGS